MPACLSVCPSVCVSDMFRSDVSVSRLPSEVGAKMGARHVLLTHFSQRYASLPLLPEPAPANVGIAYDNMVVGATQRSARQAGDGS